MGTQIPSFQGFGASQRSHVALIFREVIRKALSGSF